MNSNKRITNLIRGILLIVAFILGMIAYKPYWEDPTFTEINTVFDWIFYSADLMTGSNPLSNDKGGLMSLVRFISPGLTAATVISFFTTFVIRVALQLRSRGHKFTIFGKTFGRDSVAIYGTNDFVRQIALGTHFIHSGDYFLKNAKKHIILMDNDDDSLSFYKKHESELSRDSTYIGLQQISSFLMKSTKNVFFFNIYEEVARAYWKKYSIRTAIESDPTYNIVILGYTRDNLGYQLLRYGIMNNVFRKDQKISYHIFCKPEEIDRGFELFRLQESELKRNVHTDGMLCDTITWYPEQWQKNLDIIQSANRILLCRTINPHILNQLLLTCTQQQIHYYDPDIASYPEQYAYPNMRAFGSTKTVLNECSILKRELHRDAMERNFQYEKKFGKKPVKDKIHEAEKSGTIESLKLEFWDDLDGFTKSSNIATSDYYTINPVDSDLTEQGVDHRAELEHIRWCRFHFLCGWKYGQPKDEEKRKDPELRIHRVLIPWDILPEEDREKDRQQVRMEILQ